MDLSRRDLFKIGGKLLVLASAGATLEQIVGAEPAPDAYKMADHWWGMIIDIEECIGCGNCVRACSKENQVADGYFRTWVERYVIEEEGKQPQVESPKGAIEGFPPLLREDVKSFFVPKLCNHCADSPCVQVCPVGATFRSPDGVVLVDKTYCLGCRYCVQACPYGCRFLDPRTDTVDKCTLCYHRITQGLTTACCENCPTGARQLVDFKNPKDPVHEFLRKNKVQVLKPYMATEAKVFYKNLDGAVR
ncbi:MAG TPA: 4Fe-4S dicluster domain-containing protein [Candidatus Limnocylindrales bacterium]|nr:4Fe-4S dicluster domain-containing protein [Candidatus Limnocylindrales bacterium]